MSLYRAGHARLRFLVLAHGLRQRLFIHGRPSTLAPCPSVAQLVIVMPTPRYSRVPYALCPALYLSAYYIGIGAGGVCTSLPYPIHRVGIAFLRCALAPYVLLSVYRASHHTLGQFNPSAHSRVSTATDCLPLADGVQSTLSGIFFCRLPPFPTLSRHAF